MNKILRTPSKTPLIANPMNLQVLNRLFLHGFTAGLALAVLACPVPAMAQRPAGPASLRPVYDQWTTYFNQRFAFEVPVPPVMRAQSDPRKGSSCRFVSEDGLMVLKAWGNTLVPGPGDPLEGAWREAMNLRGRRIDFQRRTPYAFVLAGVTADGAEFFEKVILGNGATAGFNVAYPASMARRMSGVVNEIEQGFGWHPQAAALSPEGVPQPGFFSGMRGFSSGGEPPDRAQSENPTLPRDPSQTRVDLTPPPPVDPANAGESAPELSLEKSKASGPPAPAPVKPAAPAKREDLPFGIVIPGKPGYVYSPFSDNRQQVDVTGIPTGTKVKCPYTSKVFRVP
jgi:hypothetical protein